MKYKVLLWYPTTDVSLERLVENVEGVCNDGVEYEFVDNKGNIVFSAPCERVVCVQRVDG